MKETRVSAPHAPSQYKILLTSLFIIGNLYLVAWANASAGTRKAVFDGCLSILSFDSCRALCVDSLRLGYLTGVGNRWVMFSEVPHARTWYTIEATFENSPQRKLLPLPEQSARSFLERTIVDFREPKLLLTVSPGSANDSRTRYAKYLCRKLSVKKITSIAFVSHTQLLWDRATAAAKGYHLQPKVSALLIEEIRC